MAAAAVVAAAAAAAASRARCWATPICRATLWPPSRACLMPAPAAASGKGLLPACLGLLCLLCRAAPAPHTSWPGFGSLQPLWQASPVTTPKRPPKPTHLSTTTMQLGAGQLQCVGVLRPGQRVSARDCCTRNAVSLDLHAQPQLHPAPGLRSSAIRNACTYGGELPVYPPFAPPPTPHPTPHPRALVPCRCDNGAGQIFPSQVSGNARHEPAKASCVDLQECGGGKGLMGDLQPHLPRDQPSVVLANAEVDVAAQLTADRPPCPLTFADVTAVHPQEPAGGRRRQAVPGIVWGRAPGALDLWIPGQGRRGTTGPTCQWRHKPGAGAVPASICHLPGSSPRVPARLPGCAFGPAGRAAGAAGGTAGPAAGCRGNGGSGSGSGCGWASAAAPLNSDMCCLADCLAKNCGAKAVTCVAACHVKAQNVPTSCRHVATLDC